MNEKLSALFTRIKADSNLLTVSEAQTSQGIVLPILNNLGWEVFDTTEVTPEYSVGGRRVDFALRIQLINKVFLEIKKTSENLENHQEQLVYYAFQQGVKLAILTNGITWQFYLPLEEGSWEHRRFFTIDLMEQSLDDAIEKFEGLLSRKNIASGNAYQTAKSLYEGRQKNKIIKENLPKAWQKLISEPDEMLIELLNETLEKISGYKAENGQITDFLQSVFPNFLIGILTPSNITATDVHISNSQTEFSNNRNVISLNLNKLENLLHTKVLKAKFDDKVSPNNWRSVLDTGLKIALKKGISVENIQNELSINFKEGVYNLQGFFPIEDANYSWQNQDANKTAKNVINLAKLLNCEIYVLFEWREKGKFPMKQGLIHWKP
ncbi:MAG: restriction endonuclease subunit R [Acidobacteriota bacterium]